MKWLMTLTASALTLGLSTGNAQACPNAGELVETWHVRYLGRHADRVGMRAWMGELQRGVPIEVVEANFLACEEYYLRQGRCPERFVRALYRDVLGELNPCGKEVFHRAAILRHGGCRKALALDMIRAARVRFSPAPVTVVAPRPITVVEPVVVTTPRVIERVVVPAPIHRVPVYTPPHNSFSIRIRF